MLAPPAVLDSAASSQRLIQSRRRLNRSSRWSVWLLGLLVWPALLTGAEPPAEDMSGSAAAQQTVPGPLPAVKTTKKVKPPPTREQKRKVVVVTSIVIAGILTILLCMLLWIVWWSRRTHRLLRAPLPAANRGDELWYLKTKRPPNPTADNPKPDSPPAPPQT